MKKITHKYIPALDGELADQFIKKADDNLKKIGTIDFSGECETARKILKKSNL